MSEENAQGANNEVHGDDSLVKDLKAEAAQRRIENKELKEKLDTLMAERKQAEETTAAEQGKFKELYESTNAEVDTLKAQLEEAQEKLAGYEARDTERLNKLMESVPEDRKPLIKESFSLADRIELAESFAQVEANAPRPRLPGEGGDNVKNPWNKETLNLTEQARILREDRALADRLKRDAA